MGRDGVEGKKQRLFFSYLSSCPIGRTHDGIQLEARCLPYLVMWKFLGVLQGFPFKICSAQGLHPKP
jgi:hypothetical protein